MTIAFADTVDRQENKDLIRWGASLVLVLVFHVAVAWLLLPREAPVEPSKPPPPAALLDLPPLPPAGAGGKPGSPPPPKPPVVQPAPPKPPVEEVKPPVPPAQEIKPPVPPVPPIPKFAVPLPVAPPKPQPLKPLPPRTAPTPPPQATGSAAPLLLDPMRVWQLAAVQRLEKFKKQSVAASWNGEQGVVGLNISIDRQGNILFASIASSSGYSSLDNQALSMCRLARRLPPLPPEFKREQYSFGVTIEFSLY
jgi:periplasmic protein TonB